MSLTQANEKSARPASFVLALKSNFDINIKVYAITIVLLLLIALFSLTSSFFFTQDNLINILSQTAPRLVAALAVTFVMTSSGIDLSTGSNVALTGVIAAMALAAGIPGFFVILIALFVGAMIGLLQGWFIAYRGLFAFIVTLAGFYVFRGIALVITQGYSITTPQDSLISYLGPHSLLGLPISVYLAAILSIFSWWLFVKTPFGRYTIAFGSNKEALRRTGINIKRLEMFLYIFSGMFTAVAALIVLGQLGSGSSNTGLFFELEVITVVVLGGTNLFGGRGSILGTVVGALVFSVILNGLVLSGVNAFYVQVIQGSILLLAILVNTILDRRSGLIG